MNVRNRTDSNDNYIHNSLGDVCMTLSSALSRAKEVMKQQDVYAVKDAINALADLIGAVEGAKVSDEKIKDEAKEYGYGWNPAKPQGLIAGFFDGARWMQAHYFAEGDSEAAPEGRE